MPALIIPSSVKLAICRVPQAKTILAERCRVFSSACPFTMLDDEHSVQRSDVKIWRVFLAIPMPIKPEWYTLLVRYLLHGLESALLSLRMFF